ncbi:hypothetical protein [Aquimarina sp. MMG016]|uniref:hypothetical protein n=1 Tax=Aquimarina sp. MMG016 TaxID=2822690 RepID=UPI001B39DAF9|nr:hypothetical protein [Aquimarina sp. MMG016]MBQ4820681.1 hypothetical protein [Aquimarina sp. MMG016]
MIRFSLAKYYRIISGKKKHDKKIVAIQELQERNIALQAKLNTLDDIEAKLKEAMIEYENNENIN